MSGLRQVMAVGVACLVCLPARLAAQAAAGGALETTPANAPRQRVGRVIVPEAVQPAPPWAVSVRPTALGREPISLEVKNRIRAFEDYRQQYLKRQEELRKQLQGTTDQDRERIRVQLQEFSREWREQLRAGRRDMLEQRDELLRRLPGHRELLEEVRRENREAIRTQKDRRGLD